MAERLQHFVLFFCLSLFALIQPVQAAPVSDDFSSGALDAGLWTAVDPVGDGTVAVTGAGTADAHLLLAVPAGTSHDIWTAGNDALRVMQPAADEDFEIEIKFESEPTQRYQLQGLLVEQDADNFLRLDFYSDGNKLRMFAARFVAGSPTVLVNQVVTGAQVLHLRLTRVGDQWTPAYSYDGASWSAASSFTHSLSVSAVGVFAGNAGGNPAFTAAVDYFFNTVAPIDPEDAPSDVSNNNWWSNLNQLRMPIVVDSGPATRIDEIVVAPIDFTALFADAGVSGSALDVNSLRLLEVADDGSILSHGVPFQFDPNATFDEVTNAQGELVLLLEGLTPPNSQRHYHLYFNWTDGSIAVPPPPVQDRIWLTDDVPDAGQASVNVGSLDGDWYYHKQGAGFSSLVDAEGNDWIGYSEAAGAEGEYRGIPNLVYPEGHFHPGATSATSVVTRQGPLRATIESSTADGWSVLWDIYPRYAKLTVNQAPKDYWFLYEGTPGGSLDPTSDIVVRSSGEETLAADSWTADLDGEEWVYFGDTGLNRSLYVVNHLADGAVDSYRPLQDAMTVFGFGRQNLVSQLTGTNRSFTVGLTGGTDFATVATAARSRFTETTTVAMGAVEMNASADVVALAVADAVAGPVPLTIMVDGGGSYADGDSIVGFDWRFGETATASGATQTHTFNEPGVYLVELDVTTAAGQTGTDRFTVVVGELAAVSPSNLLPQAIADANITAGDAPLDVAFDGSSSSDADGQLTDYVWDFGDGTGAAGPTATHTYTQPGVYVATLTVSDDSGAVASDNVVVTVGDVHTLTISAVGNGTVLKNPDKAAYATGDVVELTAAPDPGWEFVGWSGALSGTGNPAILTIEADAAVTAEFASDTTPPVISNVQVTAGETSATLSWETDEPATSTVAYGEGTGYELGTVDAATVPTTTQSVTLSNLTTATTYHYQITATDPGGNSTATADAIFTTTDGGAGGSGGGIVSDDFQAATLDTGLWTIADPVGDGTVTMTGTGTADARLLLSVPAGTSHDIWTAGNDALRVMQPAVDEDFEIEVKFESEPTQSYQLQGLLVEQDADNFLRVDFVSDGSALRLYAIRFVAGSPTVLVNQVVTGAQVLHLRLTRVGDQWTPAYSYDGASWSAASSFTHSLSVSAVGVFAGNAGSNPAHTAVVDYFFNTLEPIVPEDGLLCAPGETFNLTTTVLGAGVVARAPDQASYSCGEAVTLTAQPDAGVAFIGWSDALSGTGNPAILTIEADAAVTAEFASDTTPPVISNVQVTAGETSATLSWETDEPATSTVAYGEGTGYELGTVDAATVPTTTHSVTLSNLTTATTYHYQITATDPGGNSTATADAIFTTTDGGAGGSGGGIVSDDFQAATLDTGLWTIADPVGDGTVTMTGPGTADARLLLSVPAGTSHDIWTAGNDALRVMQPAADEDFEIEVKFESEPTAKYQLQGLLVEQDADDFLRVDFVSDGSTLRLYAIRFVAGSPTVLVNQVVTGAQVLHLRLTRVGDQWTPAYSYDGASWSAASSFTHSLSVSAVGVFAGNAGSNPAHTAVVDYFFNTLEPIVPEDGLLCAPGETFNLTTTVLGAGVVARAPDQASYSCGEAVTLTAQPGVGSAFIGWSGALSGTDNPGTLTIEADAAVTAEFASDTTPPVISNVQVTAGETSATLSWETDEPATSTVAYGEGTGYELGTVDAATVPTTTHSVTLSNLTTATTYHYQITATDPGGNSTATADAAFDTLAEGSDNPLIGVWYGSYQPFGYLGIPQQWINILGHVVDPDGVASLSYSLNGGPARTLSMGPDDRRLADEGDFVVEIDYVDPDLVVGLNTVVISATDSAGNTSIVGVDVDFGGTDNVWPMPYSVDWDAVANLQDVVQVVDGDWALVPDGVRTVQIDYDRLLAVGDMSWQNYEITVPITIHGLEESGPKSGPQGVGIILRWTGHTDDPAFCAQPHCGWLPSGPIAWWREGELSLGGRVDADVQLQNGVRYFWKVRVETQTTDEHLYSFKVWEDGDLEPLDWNLQRVRSAGEIAAGSALLIAHHMDVTFGDIDITPVAAPSPPPVISDVQVLVSDTTAEVSWLTDQPATSRVDYGLTSSYELGTVTDELLKTAHSLILSGLQPGTLYHFQIASVAEDGSVATTGDSTFTTTGGQDFSGIVSDDFNLSGLDTGLWTVVDPVGDGSVAVTGAGTTDARLQLSVPAGTSHDVWTAGNDALRVMQPAADEDFEIEVKFESEPTQRYQFQGLLVEQDADNFLRLDFFSDGSVLRVFAARFVGGVPTTLINQSIASSPELYLRLTRQGDAWTPQYSNDGVSWSATSTFTHALAVSAVGVYAGNAGASPAHTAVVDYFFNTFEPVVPEDSAAP